MGLLAALFVVVLLLGAVVAGYAHLAGRLARLERANELLLDLVSTHMTLGPAEAARLGVTLAADQPPSRPPARRPEDPA